ncbi:1242_t:CDS:2, partial [Racocetra fulgida]
TEKCSLYEDAIVDAELTNRKVTNTEKAGEVNSLNYFDTISTPDHKKAKTLGVSFDEYVDSNIQDESENDKEINFDLLDISKKLQREQVVKWEVDDINVTNRFQNYQKEIFKKAEREGLDYENL